MIEKTNEPVRSASAAPADSPMRLPLPFAETALQAARAHRESTRVPEGYRDGPRGEEIVRRREVELTAFVETALIGLHCSDPDGRIIWANQAELDILGLTREEYFGWPMRDFFTDPALVDDMLHRVRRGESVRSQEAALKRKDGSVRTVLIDANALWSGGEFIHSQCFVRDITQERQAEELGRLASAIIEWSDDAIVSKDLNGIIRSWNRGAERMFGYTAEETVGRPILMLLPADRQQEEPRILAQLRRGERVDHFETIRRRKDGALINVSLTISPIKDNSGRVIGASKIARDITERKRSEAALEAARRALAEANEALEARVLERTASLREAIAQMEEFSYTVSHDLRAPLRGMLGYSQALLEDYGATLKPEIRHWLTRIAENATRLDRMVTDVLSFSRVSRADIQLERIDLDPLVRQIVQQYPSFQPPQAHVEVGPLHPVQGHEPSVAQIVSNLLANGVKFVAPNVVPEIRIWSERRDRTVRLFVRDNGIGVAPEHQARLFKMFERVHPDSAYEGTGIGLAIVRKAANRMGGQVGVESDGVHGSTFWVDLPAPAGA